MKGIAYYHLHHDEGKRTASVAVYGEISSSAWPDGSVSSKSLVRDLEGLDVDQINVYINSPGGEVAEGLAIHNALRRHPAKVRTECDGFACSAASVVFMAGDERVMYPASLLFIHDAWVSASGNADELRRTADDLDAISATAASVYRARVNISDEELDRLLAEESWITPAQAVEWGFATAIEQYDTGKAPQQSAMGLIYAALTRKPEPLVPREKTVATFLSALSAKGV